MNPIVSSLPAYTEEHRLPLIAKSVLGGRTAGLFTLQSGVKGATALNLVATDIALQDASSCGFTASGTTTMSQRVLTPAYLKVNHEFCDKELLGTWANYQVKIAAGQKTLPFEEDFVNGIVNGVQEKVEKMLWQGNSSNSNECDGILTVLSGATGVITGSTSASAYADIKAVYASTPEAVKSKDDYVIMLSSGRFESFIQELVSANLYHYEANDAPREYKLPGTTVRVIGVEGLIGVNDVIGARLSNLFYGTDMQDDNEKFDLWYSKDNGVFRLAIEFIAGTQVAYPNEVVRYS